MTVVADYCLVHETPEMHGAPAVAEAIRQEQERPSKQWINSIIRGEQEQDQIVRRTESYVLLPDTERLNRYHRVGQGGRRTLNWLSILLDTSVRSMRDLRGGHLPVLRDMLEGCLETIERETGIERDQVMAYVHYPPSVFQLHVHFSYPYGQFNHKDAFRIHGLRTVINNLEVDPDYYLRATLTLPLSRQSAYYRALFQTGAQDEDKGAREPDAPDDDDSPVPVCGLHKGPPRGALPVQPLLSVRGPKEPALFAARERLAGPFLRGKPREPAQVVLPCAGGR